MEVTVIVWNIYSEFLKKNVRIELGYPMRDFKNALRMFFKEYPKAEADIEHISTYEFNSEDRQDLYRAFENSGCIRTWRSY